MTTSPEHDGRDAPHRDAHAAGFEPPPADLSRRVLLGCEGELATLELRGRRRTRLALAAVGAVALFTLTLHHVFQAPTVVPLAVPGTLAAAEPTEEAAWHGSSGAAGATGIAVSLASDGRSAPPAPVGAAHWLASALRPDGQFDTGALEVPRADEVGLHAFALLALASAGPEAAAQPETADAALRAARWLLQQQDDDGSIGAPVGAGFDHALATVALLEAGALTGDAAVAAGAGRAVALIAERQGPDGGWRPRAAGLPGSAPAQTAWTLAALLRAQQLGVPELEHAIARGQSRLAADLAAGRAPGGRGAPAGPAVAAADLDLAAVRAVALGGSRARGPAPAAGLYAASLAVLAAPALPR